MGRKAYRSCTWKINSTKFFDGCKIFHNSLYFWIAERCIFNQKLALINSFFCVSFQLTGLCRCFTTLYRSDCAVQFLLFFPHWSELLPGSVAHCGNRDKRWAKRTLYFLGMFQFLDLLVALMLCYSFWAYCSQCPALCSIYSYLTCLRIMIHPYSDWKSREKKNMSEMLKMCWIYFKDI